METILLFAPLIGALLAGFGWRWFGEQLACIIATALLFLSMILSWALFIGFDGETYSISILRWVESGSLFTDWAIRIDRLTAIMLIVITSVSALVHLYSFGYMAHDDNFREGGGESKQSERFYAAITTRVHQGLDDVGTSPMTNRSWHTTPLSPTVVAIHNDGNVLGGLAGGIGGKIHSVTTLVIRFPSNQLL